MKLFRSNIPSERKSAIEYVKWLIINGKTFKIEIWSPKRSNKINSYLHVLLGIIALSYHDTIENVKRDLYKVRYNIDTFKSDKFNRDGVMVLRSSADLTDKEMSLTVERLRDGWMKDTGEYLPDATEDLSVYQFEIDKNKRWL